MDSSILKHLDDDSTFNNFGYRLKDIAPFSFSKLIAICVFCREKYVACASTINRSGRTCCKKCAQVSSSYSRGGYIGDEHQFWLSTKRNIRKNCEVKINDMICDLIDIDATHIKFGYRHEDLTRGSRKPVIVNCEFCLKKFEVRYAALLLKKVVSCRDCMPVAVSFAHQTCISDKYQFWKSRRPELNFDLIDENATIIEYGHNPRQSKPFCRKRLIAKCFYCGDIIKPTMDYFSKSNSCVACKKCIRRKTVDTIRERYGVTSVLDIPSVKIKYAKTSIETIIERLLIDRYKIEFTNQFCIDAGEFQYSFDFYIPSRNLLIECQGDYFHDFKTNGYSGTPKDRAKARYVENNTNFKLIHIWEHEIHVGRVTKILDRHINEVQDESISVDLSKIEFKPVNKSDAYTFLSQYHYLGGLGNFGHNYGALYNDTLIAICSFSGTTRSDSRAKLERIGINLSGDVRELRRFCIRPGISVRNLASFCLRRFLNLYKKDSQCVAAIISFSDPTVGDIGTIYKATNWEKLPDAPPSYHYLDPSTGKMIHKKTVWNLASKAHMTEREFSNLSGLLRVEEKAKNAWLMMF